jgi:hypothetical protein
VYAIGIKSISVTPQPLKLSGFLFLGDRDFAKEVK